MIRLISVQSATATAVAGQLTVKYTGDLDDGVGPQSLEYGYLGPGDPHGLGPAFDAFFQMHPDFPVNAYVPPVPSTNPADYILSKRQICAALIVSGTSTTPETFVQGIIAAISDPTAKALALNDWANAPFYLRSNPLFNEPELLAAAGMVAAQIDALWLLAKTLPQ